jgi:hypothetical protein
MIALSVNDCISHRSWVLSAPTAAHGVTLADMFEDLTPYLALGFDQIPGLTPPSRGVSSYDFSEVASLFQNAYARSGTSIVGLPVGFDGRHLVHHSNVDLPRVGNGTAVTWDDLIDKLLVAAEEDRDGDGIKDKPLCVKDLCGESDVLLQYIASSIIQTRGPEQQFFFDPVEFRLLIESPAWLEALRIYARLSAVIDWSETSCVEGTTSNGFIEWIERNHPYGRGVRNDAHQQYATGRCVALFTFYFNEPTRSPSTAVGSALVPDGSRDGHGPLVECHSHNCPRGLPSSSSSSSQLVNVAPMLIGSVRLNAIDKRSLLKEEAWQFLSYIMLDENLYRDFIIRTAEPTIPTTKWFDADELNATTRRLEIANASIRTADEAPVLASDLNYKAGLTPEEALAKMKADLDNSNYNLSTYLANARLELSDDRNLALILHEAFNGVDEPIYYALMNDLKVLLENTVSYAAQESTLIRWVISISSQGSSQYGLGSDSSLPSEQDMLRRFRSKLGLVVPGGNASSDEHDQLPWATPNKAMILSYETRCNVTCQVSRQSNQRPVFAWRLNLHREPSVPRDNHQGADSLLGDDLHSLAIISAVYVRECVSPARLATKGAAACLIRRVRVARALRAGSELTLTARK